jgi:hypothetical protein
MTVLLIAAAWIALLSLVTGLCSIARLGDRADSASASAAIGHSELLEQPLWGSPAAKLSAAERVLAASAEESSREFAHAHGHAGSVAA